MRALRLEAEDVLGIELGVAGGGPLPFSWAAGAHVDLRLGNGLVRQYSVISLPEDGHLNLAIKRAASRAVRNGCMSSCAWAPASKSASRATRLPCSQAAAR